MWVRIVIGLVVALLLYTGASEEQKDNIKEGFSNIVGNITDYENSTEIPNNNVDVTSLTLLGKPTKEILFDCEKNRDCIEFGDNAICEGGSCYA